MNTLSFDEDFLLKYGGLFHKVRLDVFTRHIEKLNEALRKRYKQRISIYWYIHGDDENEILVARHMQMDSNDLEDKKSFAKYFLNVLGSNFPHMSSKNTKNFYLSYAVVQHGKLEFVCINPNEEREKQVYKYSYASFENIFEVNRDLYNTFIKVEKISPFEEKVKVFFQVVTKYIFEHFPKFSSILFSFITFVLLSKLRSIPMGSIELNVISFSIIYSLAFFIISLSFIGIFIWVLMISMTILVGLLSRRVQMEFEAYTNHEPLAYSIGTTIGTAFLILFIISIQAVLTDEQDLFSDIAIENYLSDTQIPMYLRMEFKDLNTSQVENVLYLGETKQNILFLLDKDLNALIYQDEYLTKEICMGPKHHSFTQSMLPMINRKTFDNQIYRRTHAKNVEVSLKRLSFQDTFCFLEYPKAIEVNSTKQIILLMGKPGLNRNDIFYIDMPTIKEKVVEKPELCEVKKESEFIRKLMRSEVLKSISYKTQKIKDIDADTKSVNLFNLVCDVNQSQPEARN